MGGLVVKCLIDCALAILLRTLQTNTYGETLGQDLNLWQKIKDD